MPKNDEPQILLTNDDGIESEGLWAAAEGLSSLGFVTVAAPREQYSGAGRSMPIHSDGVLREEEVSIHGVTWKVYAVGGSPAQAVQHGILELMPDRPDLVVSGINHGENLTVDVTISGTVGAALEGAAFGCPAMAVSLQMPKEHHLNASGTDFEASAHFTCKFASILLQREKFADVDVLKVDVPAEATPETDWCIARLSRQPYYIPLSPQRTRLSDSARLDFEIRVDEAALEPDSDVYAVRVKKLVAVTPLSLDMTSRVDFEALDQHLRA